MCNDGQLSIHEITYHYVFNENVEGKEMVLKRNSARKNMIYEYGIRVGMGMDFGKNLHGANHNCFDLKRERKEEEEGKRIESNPSQNLVHYTGLFVGCACNVFIEFSSPFSG